MLFYILIILIITIILNIIYWVYLRIPWKINSIVNRYDSINANKPRTIYAEYKDEIYSPNLEKQLRLGDFYCPIAYKSYLLDRSYFDTIDERSIEACIMMGARGIHIDVFPSKLGTNASLVVCNGAMPGNWHYTTNIPFRRTIQMIKNVAFGRKAPNNMDPLLLFIHLHLDRNYGLYERARDDILDILGDRLVEPVYRNGGNTESGKNIVLAPMKDLSEKIILGIYGWDGERIESDLLELSNLSEEAGNFKITTYDQIEKEGNLSELRNINKQVYTLVIPEIPRRITNVTTFSGFLAYPFEMISNPGRQLKAAKWVLGYGAGCQGLGMFWMVADERTDSYRIRFKDCAFRRKPYKLRYHPVIVKEPKLPEADTTPKEEGSGDFSFQA